MLTGKIKLLLVVFLLLGLLSGLGLTRYLLQTRPNIFCNSQCQASITPDRRFFSDELILFGQTESQKPFLLHLDLNRKRVTGSYTHYYFADLVYEGNHNQLYTSFTNDSQEAQPHDFLSSFSSSIATDLSSRESYKLNFDKDNLHLTANLNNFNGDFIEKNTIDYTKYISEGDGQVTINGKSYTMHAMLSKIYSPFYDKYIFFKGYDNLNSLAQFLVLWDSDGNFYALDDSQVAQDLPEYKSHTWVLYKNKQSGFTKKAFSANVQAEQHNFVPQKWSINIPDFDSNLELAPIDFVSKNIGVASGTVTTASGTKTLNGFFSFTKYGD
ncbi:MAG TPA: hypothetical protein VE973_01245 [Candidatus Limnocylindria bacterium]|nr:hypothetical protein [Candidatus Limnocylindria bacterium]